MALDWLRARAQRGVRMVVETLIVVAAVAALFGLAWLLLQLLVLD